MAGIFNINHDELDSKINELSNKIDRAQPVFVSPSKHEWDSVFELSKEINENFKNVRYPSKQERDIAWQKFANLRDNAFKVYNQQIFDCSKRHYKGRSKINPPVVFLFHVHLFSFEILLLQVY